MKNLVKRQRGLTFISMLVLLGIIASVVLLILKVVPMYIEHGKVTSALNKLKEEPDLISKPDVEIINKLFKQFDIDDVKGVTKDDVSVTKSGSYLKVEIEYAPETNVAGNLSIKLSFDDVMEIGQE
ncbi:MAG: DUF4845 domain-containing protein [Methylococcaceae bacterium]